MFRWKNCETRLPKRRNEINMLSETVLIYDGVDFSIGFYDYEREEWKDITVNAYISDMSGGWRYLKKPHKKLKIMFE